MNFAMEFIEAFFSLLNEVSIYILLGLFLASIAKALLPQNFIKNQIGKNDFKSILKASAFGIPLPLCSCSVLPFAQSLKKEGASKSSIQSFLISAPITGIDSIMVTYGAFGFWFTFTRVFSSFFIAFSAGISSLIFDAKFEQKKFISFSKTPPQTINTQQTKQKSLVY